jgi:hypothetical protein
MVCNTIETLYAICQSLKIPITKGVKCTRLAHSDHFAATLRFTHCKAMTYGAYRPPDNLTQKATQKRCQKLKALSGPVAATSMNENQSSWHKNVQLFRSTRVEKEASLAKRAANKPKKAVVKRVPKPSSDEIFERLLLAIMEHRLPPGTQLVEARLAAIFKVSRTKVREAIGRLVHDCIATNIPNRGAFRQQPDGHPGARSVCRAAPDRTGTGAAGGTQGMQPRRSLQSACAPRAKEEAAQKRRRHAPDHHAVWRVPLSALPTWRATVFCRAHCANSKPVGTDHHPVRHADPRGVPGDHPALVDAIEAGDEARAAELMLHHLAHVESSVRLESPQLVPDPLEEMFS